MVDDWVPRVKGLPQQKGEQYVDLLKKVWSRYAVAASTYLGTTAVLEAWAGEPTNSFPEQPTGGNTRPDLDTWVEIKELRGDVDLVPVEVSGQVVDWQFERLNASTYLRIRKGDKSLVIADPVALEINRHGDWLLTAKDKCVWVDGATGSDGSCKKIDGQKAVRGDLQLQIEAANPQDPGIQGGLVLYDLGFDPVTIDRFAGTVGIGDTYCYVGAQIDAKFQGFAVGGGFLVGEIKPASSVLRTAGFGDLLDKLGDSGQSSMTGAYLRVYGTYPVIDIGCIFEIGVGGDVSAWYFHSPSDGHVYGGKLRGYVYGSALCLFSAKGDISLTLAKPAGQSHTFEGEMWVAGGFGFCDPETWHTWEGKWWGDGWCYTCGALVGLEYRGGWDYWYDMECE
jgi:hypothetical protein